MKTLEEKIGLIESALERLAGHEENCRLCPRECFADRKKHQTGYCGTGSRAALSHGLLHFGEEPVLSGNPDFRQKEKNGHISDKKAGSGTLFFSGCPLKCLFCQNFQLSWEHRGRALSDNELAREMLRLQGEGALNINLVSPTHILIPLLRALKIAYKQGLSIPLVYNSSGYEKKEILKLLDGIIDIYLPDFKYACSGASARLSGASDYFEFAQEALIEMVRQQPHLELTKEGNALKGVIMRHLVLPGYIHNSLKVLEWTAENLSNQIPLSLMSQYFPCYKAPSDLQRRLNTKEYGKILAYAQELGFSDLFIQPYLEQESRPLIPDFSQKIPFLWDGD
ncbi:MAG: hypothetical protein JXB26_02805 [Candidatus Aminicenantes bacterium]|nr:hypothetical protein [Candidatus Aminicenantes bacterium]